MKLISGYTEFLSNDSFVNGKYSMRFYPASEGEFSFFEVFFFDENSIRRDVARNKAADSVLCCVYFIIGDDKSRTQLC